MKLTFSDYKDKVTGCWLGKNIGGVLGAPFECTRLVNNVEFYTQDLSAGPPPNDDLDLQLVWLNAVERYGRHTDARILGEYWLSFIIPDFAEYGAGKNNLRMGLPPPLSGSVENPYKDSNGAFIRSELWACLAPGHPEIAVRYAYEDAIVDHADEGLYGEIFCAAVQSAAFVESDKYKLIDIGLSYIPERSGVAKGIKTAMESYKSGLTFAEARKNVLTAVPGSFGVIGKKAADIPTDVPVGKAGYDAPSNIGITMIGWLYGEDDFGKSLCIANNCGEDTDCTCATLGAIFGILHGAAGIPQKWKEPVGDKISTFCINLISGGISIPKTVTELVDRTLRLTPSFLGAEFCDLPESGGYTIETNTGEALYCEKGDVYVPGLDGTGDVPRPYLSELLACSPFAMRYQFITFYAVLDYMGEPYIRIGEAKKLKLSVMDSGTWNGVNNQWLTVKWYAQDGVSVLPGKECGFFLKPFYKNKTELEFEIQAEYFCGKTVELIIDISVNGRHTNGLIKVILIPRI